jgi:hypothetical protein
MTWAERAFDDQRWPRSRIIWYPSSTPRPLSTSLPIFMYLGKTHTRMSKSKSLMRLLVCFVVLGINVAVAFAPTPMHYLSKPGARASFTIPRGRTTIQLQATPQLLFVEAASSNTLAAAVTIDPTAFLGNALGAFLTSPAILAIPVVAALLVGGLVAWFLVASAAPEVEDD